VEPSFRKRLLAAHATLAMLVLLGTVTALVALRYTVTRQERARVGVEVSSALQHVDTSTQRLAYAVRRYVLSRDSTDRRRVGELTAALALARAQLRSAARSQIDVAMLDSRLDEYTMMLQRTVADALEPSREALLRIDEDLRPVRSAVIAALEPLTDQAYKETTMAFERADRVGGRTRWTLLLIATLAILLIVGLARALFQELDRTARRARDMTATAKKFVDARSELAAGSRDIEQALETIRASTGALSTGIRAPSETRELAAIGEATRRLEDRLDKLFDATGTLSVHSESCDPAGLIEQAISARRDAAIARAVRLRSESDAALPVQADRERITRVLSALIDTTLHGAPAGSEIVVRAVDVDDAVKFAITGPSNHTHRGLHEQNMFRRLIEAHGGRMGQDLTGWTMTSWFTLPTGPRVLR
jgi:K+-sensing histidine kinase KdpD